MGVSEYLTFLSKPTNFSRQVSAPAPAAAAAAAAGLANAAASAKPGTVCSTPAGAAASGAGTATAVGGAAPSDGTPSIAVVKDVLPGPLSAAAAGSGIAQKQEFFRTVSKWRDQLEVAINRVPSLPQGQADAIARCASTRCGSPRRFCPPKL